MTVALSTGDKMEILELAARYNHAIDGGQAETWAATFTANGVFASPQGTFEGTEALCQFAGGFGQQMAGARHWTNNHVIDGDGDSATHTCYLNLVQSKEAGKTLAMGLYRDELKKIDGAWKFTRREVTIDS